MLGRRLRKQSLRGGHLFELLLKIEHFSKTLLIGLWHQKLVALKSVIYVLGQVRSRKLSEHADAPIATGRLHADERALLKAADPDSPPTEGELAKLVAGYEQRIREAVMARVSADSVRKLSGEDCKDGNRNR
jgi:hypothetical protein